MYPTEDPIPEGRPGSNSCPERLLSERDPSAPNPLGLSHEAILRAVAESTAQLFSSGETAPRIQRLLKELGEATHVSRVYIFAAERDADNRMIWSQRQEWCAPGVVAQIDNLVMKKMDAYALGFGQMADALMRGEAVSGSIGDLPPSERQFLLEQDIQSLIVVPIMVENQFQGFIGLDDCWNERLWTDAETHALRTAAGALGALFHRTQIEENLRQSTRRIAEQAEELRQLRRAIDAGVEGVALIDANGCYAYLNQSFASMLSQTSEERLLGKPWIHGFSFASRDILMDQAIPSARENGFWQGLLGVEKPGGSLIRLEISLTALHGDKGQSHGLIVNARDISPRERLMAILAQAKQDAEAASRAKSEFLANMSHELRTPLNAVLGYSALLLKPGANKDEERYERNLRRIHEAGEHLLGLIESVLDMARIETGRLELDCRRKDLNEILRFAARMLSERAARKALTLHLDLNPEAIPVLADEGKLRQVFLNLLSNSIKFSPEGAEVMVQSRIVSGAARVNFLDRGPGIPASKRSLLFQPFEQFHRHLINEGAGLGLALSQRLAEMHGGRIWQEPRPGGGSCFSVEIPREISQPPGQGASPGLDGWTAPQTNSDDSIPPDILAGCQIMIVDDNLDSCEILMELLRMFGAKVSQAHNGAEAVASVEKDKPGIILMDLDMPIMDGFEATRRIRAMAEFEKTPILAFSAMTQERDVKKAREAGCDAFIAKPIEIRDFVRVLSRVIQKKNAT